jgi:hypothetical protein
MDADEQERLAPQPKHWPQRIVKIILPGEDLPRASRRDGRLYTHKIFYVLLRLIGSEFGAPYCRETSSAKTMCYRR